MLQGTGGPMIEFLTPDEMAECDSRTIAGGVAGIKLMERAGRAVADSVARHPLGTRMVVVAGPELSFRCGSGTITSWLRANFHSRKAIPS